MSIVNLPIPDANFAFGQTALGTDVLSDIKAIVNDYNGHITNANLDTNAGIENNKLQQISTAGKVSGKALTELANIPSGAGVLPTANGGIPSGVIMMWSGSIATIPTGFYLCDGTHSTPNLTDRFIVCASVDDSGVAKTVMTDGSTKTKSGNSNMVAHSHYNGIADDATALFVYSAVTTGMPGSATNTIVAENNAKTYQGTTSSSGSGTVTYPPYFALAYIMKS
jgi:hypothetical protein